MAPFVLQCPLMCRPLAVLTLAAALAAGGCGSDAAKQSRQQQPGDRTAKRDGVSFLVPPAWEALNANELGLVEGSPIAAARRRDGTAILTVRKAGPVPGKIAAAERALRASLTHRVPDLRSIDGRAIRTAAGPGLSFTLVSAGASGLARVVEIPHGKGSYVLELALQPNAGTSAREAGRMIRSFDG